MANKTERIQIRISKNELQQIDQKAAKAKMTRTEYMVTAALDKHIAVFDGGKEIAHQLFKIGSNINQLKILAHQGKISAVYFDKFAEEVNAVWQLLNSSISQTKPIRE